MIRGRRGGPVRSDSIQRQVSGVNGKFIIRLITWIRGHGRRLRKGGDGPSCFNVNFKGTRLLSGKNGFQTYLLKSTMAMRVVPEGLAAGQVGFPEADAEAPHVLQKR